MSERREFADPTRALLEEFGSGGEDAKRAAGELLLQMRRREPQASEAAGERLRVSPELRPSRFKGTIWLRLEIVGEMSGDVYPDLLISLDAGRSSRARFTAGQERTAMELELALNAPWRLPEAFYKRYAELSGVAPFGCRHCPKLAFTSYSTAARHGRERHRCVQAVTYIRRTAPGSLWRRLLRGARLLAQRWQLGDVRIPEPLQWETVKKGESVYYAVSEFGSVGPFLSLEEIEEEAVAITCELAVRRDAEKPSGA